MHSPESLSSLHSSSAFLPCSQSNEVQRHSYSLFSTRKINLGSISSSWEAEQRNIDAQYWMPNVGTPMTVQHLMMLIIMLHKAAIRRDAFIHRHWFIIRKIRQQPNSQSNYQCLNTENRDCNQSRVCPGFMSREWHGYVSDLFQTVLSDVKLDVHGMSLSHAIAVPTFMPDANGESPRAANTKSLAQLMQYLVLHLSQSWMSSSHTSYRSWSWSHVSYHPYVLVTGELLPVTGTVWRWSVQWGTSMLHEPVSQRWMM